MVEVFSAEAKLRILLEGAGATAQQIESITTSFRGLNQQVGMTVDVTGDVEAAWKRSQSAALQNSAITKKQTTGLAALKAQLEKEKDILKELQPLLTNAAQARQLQARSRKDEEKAAKALEAAEKKATQEFEKGLAAVKKRQAIGASLQRQKEAEAKAAQRLADVQAKASLIIDKEAFQLDKLRDAIRKNIREEKQQEQALRKVEAAQLRFNRAIQRAQGDTTKIQRAYLNLKKATDELNQSTGRGGSALRALSERMTDLSKSVQVALGPLSGVASRITAITSLANRANLVIAGFVGGTIALGAATIKGIKVAKDYETQIAQLTARVEALGPAFDGTVEDLDNLSRAFGKATLGNAAEFRTAAGLLLNVTDITFDEIERAVGVAAGLTAQGLGNIADNARILARVLQEPGESVEALRRRLIRLEPAIVDAVRSLAKIGDLAGARALILRAAEETVGDSAIKQATGTLNGAIDTLGETLNDFFEDTARGRDVLSPLTQAVNDVTEAIREFAETGSTTNKVVQSSIIAIEGFSNAVSFLARNMQDIFVVLENLVVGTIAGAFIGGLVKFIRNMAKAENALKSVGSAAARAFPIISKLLRAFLRFSIVGGILFAVVDVMSLFSNRVREASEAEIALARATREANAELVAQGKAFSAVSAEGSLLALNNAIESQNQEITALRDNVDITLREIKQAQKEIEETGGELKFKMPETPEGLFQKGFVTSSKRELAGLNDELKGLLDRKKELDERLKRAIVARDRLIAKIDETKEKRKQEAEDAEKRGKRFTELFKIAAQSVEGVEGATKKLQDRLDKLGEAGFSKVNLELIKFQKEIDTAEEKARELKKVLGAQETILFEMKTRGVDESTEEFITAKMEVDKLREQYNELIEVLEKTRGSKSAIIDVITKPTRDALRSTKELLRFKELELAATKRGEDSLAQFNIELQVFNETVKKGQELIKAGVDPEEALELAKAWGEVTKAVLEYNRQLEIQEEEAQKLREAAERFGNTFTSAFEDAIVEGQELSDVLNALEQDLVRLIFRMLVLEPIQQGIAEGFESIKTASKVSLTEDGLGGLFKHAIQGTGRLAGLEIRDERPGTGTAGFEGLTEGMKNLFEELGITTGATEETLKKMGQTVGLTEKDLTRLSKEGVGSMSSAVEEAIEKTINNTSTTAISTSTKATESKVTAGASIALEAFILACEKATACLLAICGAAGGGELTEFASRFNTGSSEGFSKLQEGVSSFLDKISNSSDTAGEKLKMLSEATGLSTQDLNRLGKEGVGSMTEAIAANIPETISDTIATTAATVSKTSENTAVASATTALSLFTQAVFEATTALKIMAAGSAGGTGGTGGVFSGLVNSAFSFSGLTGGNIGLTGPIGNAAIGLGPGSPGLPFNNGFLITGSRQGGGPVSAGRGFLVGETGPEIFVPSTSGTIVPNERVGGNKFVQNVTFNVPPGNTANLNNDQISGTILRRGTAIMRRGLS